MVHGSLDTSASSSIAIRAGSVSRSDTDVNSSKVHEASPFTSSQKASSASHAPSNAAGDGRGWRSSLPVLTHKSSTALSQLPRSYASFTSNSSRIPTTAART